MMALKIARKEFICGFRFQGSNSNSIQWLRHQTFTSTSSQKFSAKRNMLRELLEGYSIRFSRFLERNRSWIPLSKKRLVSLCLAARESKLTQQTEELGGNLFDTRMLLGAACISALNQKSEDDEDHFSDLDYIAKLTEQTITCCCCGLRLVVDQKLPDVRYCSCREAKALRNEVDGWKPFIERPNTLVWRKEHSELKGLYAYKMYGRLEDVTALNFLRVQLDTEYRKKWDSSAVELLVVEEDSESITDMVYWEMQWPRPFANRDYVFQRRVDFDPEQQICIISSLAATHPHYPTKKSMHRVTEYWSHMVVRPLGDFSQPGVEFVLTYFDNPGLSIPSAVSTWVAMTGLPNFVIKLNEAASSSENLTGPEPMLMRHVREKLRRWRTSTSEDGIHDAHSGNSTPASTEMTDDEGAAELEANRLEHANEESPVSRLQGGADPLLPTQQVASTPGSQETFDSAPAFSGDSGHFQGHGSATQAIESPTSEPAGERGSGPADGPEGKGPLAPIVEPFRSVGKRPLVNAVPDSESFQVVSNSPNGNANSSQVGSCGATASANSAITDNSALTSTPCFA